MKTKIKVVDEKTKNRRLNKLALKKAIFPKLLDCLEETINKSAIIDFQNYLKKFSEITSWYTCSDYCLEENKNSSVYSFVLFPHIKDFQLLLNEVSTNIEKELKHSGKKISTKTLNYLKNKNFFVFNFIFPKKYFSSKIFNKEIEIDFLEKHIQEIENNWEESDLKNKNILSLKELMKKFKAKNFNIQLYFKILICSFLAAYICVLLQKEKNNIEIYSWLSDRDDMTSFAEGAITAMYTLRKEEIKKIMKLEFKPITEGFVIPKNEEKPFYDALISVPDYFCGTLATIVKDDEIDLKKFKDKYIQLTDNVFQENKNIINIEFVKDINEKKLATQRLVFKNKNLI
ncbi:hypothetical protein [Fusobacterium sp. 1001295B_180824_G3]|uniref:hypothetical protein n=1 Tax=Fusobacterium sp. 1001295B_180824_G3 TaxID=2787123 RepID=UPI0018973D88|nr:hypothetical protein [Fusobacterium sp. 1001295B_180824_G3]